MSLSPETINVAKLTPRKRLSARRQRERVRKKSSANHHWLNSSASEQSQWSLPVDSGGYASQRETLVSCSTFSEAAPLMRRMLWGLCLRGHSGSSVGGFTLGDHKVLRPYFPNGPSWDVRCLHSRPASAVFPLVKAPQQLSLNLPAAGLLPPKEEARLASTAPWTGCCRSDRDAL